MSLLSLYATHLPSSEDLFLPGSQPKSVGASAQRAITSTAQAALSACTQVRFPAYEPFRLPQQQTLAAQGMRAVYDGGDERFSKAERFIHQPGPDFSPLVPKPRDLGDLFSETMRRAGREEIEMRMAGMELFAAASELSAAIGLTRLGRLAAPLLEGSKVAQVSSEMYASAKEVVPRALAQEFGIPKEASVRYVENGATVAMSLCGRSATLQQAKKVLFPKLIQAVHELPCKPGTSVANVIQGSLPKLAAQIPSFPLAETQAEKPWISAIQTHYPAFADQPQVFYYRSWGEVVAKLQDGQHSFVVKESGTSSRSIQEVVGLHFLHTLELEKMTLPKVLEVGKFAYEGFERFFVIKSFQEGKTLDELARDVERMPPEYPGYKASLSEFTSGCAAAGEAIQELVAKSGTKRVYADSDMKLDQFVWHEGRLHLIDAEYVTDSFDMQGKALSTSYQTMIKNFLKSIRDLPLAESEKTAAIQAFKKGFQPKEIS